MSAAQRLALYRTAQEGLTNIQRHAAARQAWLRLECSPDEIRLRVIDDGRGLHGACLPGSAAQGGVAGAGSGAGSGFGLRGLQERAAQLGGAVTPVDRPDGGTILTIRSPGARRRGVPDPVQKTDPWHRSGS